MSLSDKSIGIAISGSFCTFKQVFSEIKALAKENVNIYSIFSENAQKIDTRFGNANDFIQEARLLTGKDPIMTIEDAEFLGPSNILDALIIAPCTGNTIAKLANGITDTPVLMAAKGHLRNCKPLIISLATNDALGANMKNIGMLMNTKNIFFVPFGQDNYLGKPNSMISNTKLIIPTIESALLGTQIQPTILSPIKID
ncbi:MAG TPA: dipicolinate synthase subunit B [Clostridiales bacterium]|nr:dipicolinate synthase subunit B [Clostridiales bacterium]